jgi:hypothetical protein
VIVVVVVVVELGSGLHQLREGEKAASKCKKGWVCRKPAEVEVANRIIY